jgi:hypothetical protein
VKTSALIRGGLQTAEEASPSMKNDFARDRRVTSQIRVARVRGGDGQAARLSLVCFANIAIASSGGRSLSQ